ncbi:MAG: acyl carrier protein [Ruminococcus sp.]|uniref:acyl carrier protein n=1 Tax=Ruminococcus sp. TaxID=41978 RepID=UPI0025D9F3FA|nr:acyl carrier protein [Ruminococcus sp.]MCR5601017.1 acyl carrier protein [Ruminococcus sp.]
MTNKETYKKVFEEIFEVDGSELNSDFTFAAVDKWDSMTHMVLISELEARFDVMFETDDILNFGGYENGMAILARYGVDFEG